MRAGSLFDCILWLLAFFFVPMLWPWAYKELYIEIPLVFDHLYWAINGSLYFAGLIWLFSICLSTLFIARMFRFKKSKTLFLTVAVVGSILFFVGMSIIFTLAVYLEVGRSWNLNSAALFHPSFIYASLVGFVKETVFVLGVSFVTAFVFVMVGGLRLWRAERA